MLLLTMVQAVVMVSGAVVISSQTTSVRAANLLASFIIIPMAFLIQGEAIVMFWARYPILWLAIAGQLVIAGLLIRTGVAYFNREEMLGRELDTLNLPSAWARLRSDFTGRGRSLIDWYRREVLTALGSLKLPILISTLSLVIGFAAGASQAEIFRLPPQLVSFENLDQGFIEGLDTIRFTSAFGFGTVWLHNLRAVLIATLLGVFSFGVLGMLVLMLPMMIIGYVTTSVSMAGQPAVTFLTALVLPHGLLEIPAIILAGAAILNLGATLTAPAEGRTIGEAWISALAKWAKLMVGIIIPLFLLAALVEVFVTPKVAIWILGSGIK
jgi:uncharacterized membrane protein SpoIIM required for sporulation